MLSEMQQRKLTRLFTLYDADHDGGLTRGDYEQTAQRVASAYALAPGSAEHTHLVTSLVAQWDFVQRLADTDNDDRVDLAEYQAGWDNLLSNRETFGALVGSFADASIASADKDGDGRLTRQEFVGSLRGFLVADAEADDAFNRLDQNADGYLTRDELVKATDEFFNSPDPNAPGNWLLGPF